MNRATEVVLAALIFAPLVPILILISALILIIDGRPIFFLSRRMSSPTRSFLMIKFRTMSPGSDVGVTGGDKSGRVSPLGNILRRTRLDELPQILNILAGHMAFVGPRPPTPEYVAKEPDVFKRLLSGRPGVTGLATLVIHERERRLLSAGRTADAVDRIYRQRCLPKKAQIDFLYFRNRNTAFDLWLMVLTALRVFEGRPNGRLYRRRRARTARHGSAIHHASFANV